MEPRQNMIGGLALKHLHTRICEERVLVGSNPPTRITRVFHARLKGPMIACCVVWLLMEDRWQTVSAIVVIFCAHYLWDNEFDPRVCVCVFIQSFRFGDAITRQTASFPHCKCARKCIMLARHNTQNIMWMDDLFLEGKNGSNSKNKCILLL